jgi:hypothetical protein
MRRLKRLAVVLILGAFGLFALPAVSAQAMECVRVPGVGCVYPPKQCITTPCR